MSQTALPLPADLAAALAEGASALPATETRSYGGSVTVVSTDKTFKGVIELRAVLFPTRLRVELWWDRHFGSDVEGSAMVKECFTLLGDDITAVRLRHYTATLAAAVAAEAY